MAQERVIGAGSGGVAKDAIMVVLAVVFSISCGKVAGFDYSAPLTGVQVNVNGNTISYQVYDPQHGIWQRSSHSGLDAPANVHNDAGVVVWTSGTTLWHAVYDPRYAFWMRGNQPNQGVPTNVVVSPNGTVLWRVGTDSYTRGYSPALGIWQNAPAQPLALFVPSRTSGKPPLFVWFMDMSLGAASWAWDFGDGGSSSGRASHHVYNS